MNRVAMNEPTNTTHTLMTSTNTISSFTDSHPTLVRFIALAFQPLRGAYRMTETLTKPDTFGVVVDVLVQ